MSNCIHELFTDQSGDSTCHKCGAIFEPEEVELAMAQNEIAKLKEANDIYRDRMEILRHELQGFAGDVEDTWPEWFDNKGNAKEVE